MKQGRSEDLFMASSYREKQRERKGTFLGLGLALGERVTRFSRNRNSGSYDLLLERMRGARQEDGKFEILHPRPFPSNAF